MNNAAAQMYNNVRELVMSREKLNRKNKGFKVLQGVVPLINLTSSEPDKQTLPHIFLVQMIGH